MSLLAYLRLIEQGHSFGRVLLRRHLDGLESRGLVLRPGGPLPWFRRRVMALARAEVGRGRAGWRGQPSLLDCIGEARNRVLSFTGADLLDHAMPGLLGGLPVLAATPYVEADEARAWCPALSQQFGLVCEAVAWELYWSPCVQSVLLLFPPVEQLGLPARQGGWRRDRRQMTAER